jgi:hypothetical protein
VASAPLCRHCGDRPAKPRRRFCDRCYRAGVRRGECNAVGKAMASSINRPARLVDTGMRVVDRTCTLVHPDGREERPAPYSLVFEYFFAAVPKKNGYPIIWRVLRATKQGASHARNRTQAAASRLAV